MTLGELKDRIQELVATYGEEVLELDVMAEYDYGDRGHTRALTVVDGAELHVTERSGYSVSGFALRSEAEEPDEDDAGPDPEEEAVEALRVYATRGEGQPPIVALTGHGRW